MTGVRSYRDLVVWQKGMDLAALVYRLTRQLPKAEEFRLAGQLIRASASVPSNIAEGHERTSRKDYANFVSIARGSLAEVETLLELTVRAELLTEKDVSEAMSLAGEVGRMLSALRERLAQSALVPSP